jgi:hypothetical protein
MAGHIVAFSLGGIERVARGAAGGEARCGAAS